MIAVHANHLRGTTSQRLSIGASRQSSSTHVSMAAPDRNSISTAVGLLAQRYGDRVATGEAIRAQHANTLTWRAREIPDAVFWPLTTREIVEAVRIAIPYRTPLVAFGAGTSLEGHINAPLGGISIDMSRMNRILAVNANDMDCTVEAGVSRGALNRHLRDSGLFFSVDPGTEEATLGGMAATRASGTTSVRYGTMRDNVICITAVMADGQVIRTAGRARKSAAGYDLTHLLIGSEGTLGLITELTVKLHPVPEAIHVAVATFPTVANACDTAIGAIQSAMDIARVELIDAAQIGAVNAYSKLSLQAVPTLFAELHGSPSGLREQVAAFVALAESNGATGVDHASDPDERRRLWRARHEAFWAVKAAWPGKETLVTDVCVPLSRLAECIAETELDIRRSGLIAPLLGHVGDGNFHAIVVVEPGDDRAIAAADAFVDRLTQRALDMDGTCTGEHGIGQGKISALARERGAAVDTMRSIKTALDPLGILNPGKIFSSPSR